MIGSRLLGMIGLSLRQLVSDRARTTFAILGVALAVLSVTLLFGVGSGVIETGTELTERSETDLWVSGGPIEVNPQTVGGFRNPVTNAHSLARDIEEREGVRVAVPMAFQTVYVSPDGEEFDLVMGTGVRGGGPRLSVEDGEGFSNGSHLHYADGNYTGPMSEEVIVDPQTAERYGLEPGDTLHVGGTINSARRNEFEVVGISSTFRQFHRTDTVALPLSELQTLTGSAHNDRATLLTVRTTDDADTAQVKQELAEAYPEYDIRTNQEQISAVLERQALVIAGGIGIVGLAVLSGMALSLNLFLSLMYQQRQEIAVFRAVGGSRLSIAVLSLVQAMAIATVGGLIGLALTPLLAGGLDWVATTVTGFENLVQVPPVAYWTGFGLAIGFGIIGAIGGSWRTARHTSVVALTQ